MRLVVGLSGGVDSSTALDLLLRQGHELHAVTLLMSRGACASPTPEALERARLTCARLSVPHLVRDVTQAFEDQVAGPFARAYQEGRTPSPCVWCNREVKVRALLQVADELGADQVATGHYVRKVRDAQGRWLLARAQDLSKDQSYFLSALEPAQVARLHVPLADLSKAQVRDAAQREGLPAASAPDSQGVCFAPDGDYRAFLRSRGSAGFEPGVFVDEQGEVLGRHGGVADFTVGQRKGIGLAGGPWFVKALDASSGRVTITREAPAQPRSFVVSDLVLAVPAEELEPRGARVQTRHRAPCQSARYRWEGPGLLRVTPQEPGALAAPGQTCAFYQGDVVLGAGTIETIEFD